MRLSLILTAFDFSYSVEVPNNFYWPHLFRALFHLSYCCPLEVLYLNMRINFFVCMSSYLDFYLVMYLVFFSLTTRSIFFALLSKSRKASDIPIISNSSAYSSIWIDLVNIQRWYRNISKSCSPEYLATFSNAMLNRWDNESPCLNPLLKFVWIFTILLPLPYQTN